MVDHSHGCKEYCYSAFAKLKNDHLASHPKPDLRNSIHPLFSSKKFPSLNAIGYAALDLPLRLASRMLEDDRTVEYVVTTTDGSLHRDHDIDSTPGPECTFAELDASRPNKALPMTRLLRYPRVTSSTVPTAGLWVTEAMRLRSREILHNLAEILERYDIADQESDGRTDTIKEPPPSTTAKLNFPRARNAVITFSGRAVWGFLNYEEQGDPMALAEQYLLARSFVHELAHVLTQAVNGERREEVFYKNSVLSEAGFDLEIALFGGHASFHHLSEYPGHPAKLASRVVIQESYPSGRMGQQYSDKGAIVGQRAHLDPYRVVKRVPWLFITEMFTNRFWEEDVPRMGSGHIRSAKIYSWVIRLVNPGESYANAEGVQLTAKEPTTLTCSPLDQSLPERVQKILGGIASALI